jgi:hypothetical protein
VCDSSDCRLFRSISRLLTVLIFSKLGTRMGRYHGTCKFSLYIPLMNLGGWMYCFTLIRAFLRRAYDQLQRKPLGLFHWNLMWGYLWAIRSDFFFIFAIRPIFWPPGGHLENQTAFVRPINYRENRWDYFTEIWCEDIYGQYTRCFFSIFVIWPIFCIRLAFQEKNLFPSLCPTLYVSQPSGPC